jgi:hypothetical protein
MTRPSRLTRAEQLTLAGAAIRGVFSGAARALIVWILDQLQP